MFRCCCIFRPACKYSKCMTMMHKRLLCLTGHYNSFTFYTNSRKSRVPTDCSISFSIYVVLAPPPPLPVSLHLAFPPPLSLSLSLSHNVISYRCKFVHNFNSSSSFLSFHQESCPLNCALPMPGTADGDVVSRCQVLGRAGSVHHGADQ